MMQLDVVASIVFVVAAVVAVASAVAVFRVDSMARATYALAVSFIAVGAIVASFGLDYIGVIIILMMVMEMAIMAVFMVMFMGMNPALMPMDMTHSKKRSGIIAGVTFVALASAALIIPWPTAAVDVPALADATRALGDSIMGSKMLVMLIISPVMFATIVSGIVITNPRGRYERLGDTLTEEASDPQQGGVGR